MIELNWADWTLLGIIAFSSLVSVMRGFTREAISLIIWLVAFVVARSFQPEAQVLLAPYIDDLMMLSIAAFALLFITTLVFGAILGRLASFLIKITGLTTLDRVLGIGFGMARGLVLCVVIVAVVRYTPWSGQDWWSDSLVIEQLTVLEYWTRSVFASGGQDISSALANAKL